MFRKILLCVDESPTSQEIAVVGADIARRYDSEVVVLSVLDPSRFPSPPYSGLEGVQMADLHSRSLTLVAQQVRAQFESMGIRNRHMLLPGRTANTIVEVASQERASLIVMGGENKSRLRIMLEGSLWNDVARSAPCNVLRVLPPQEDPSACPPRKNRGTLIPIRRMLAVDPLAS